jgi:hypothetical protein
MLGKYNYELDSNTQLVTETYSIINNYYYDICMLFLDLQGREFMIASNLASQQSYIALTH